MRFLLYRRRSLKSPLILAYLAIASKALIEAKILQRYAMIPTPAARGVEEPPYHEPELYFYHGEFVRKVAAQDFAHGFIKHDELDVVAPGQRQTQRLKLPLRDCNARRLTIRLPRTRLIADGFALAAPLRIFFETSTKGGSGPRF